MQSFYQGLFLRVKREGGDGEGSNRRGISLWNEEILGDGCWEKRDGVVERGVGAL